MYKLMYKYLVFCLLIVIASCSNKILYDTNNIKQNDAQLIGEKIFLNETGGKLEHLMFWHPNEPFPSLGIAHFIWYPKNLKNGFNDSLPQLIAFYNSKNITVPQILQTRYAPWDTRQEFEEFKLKNPDVVKEVIDFFYNTKDIQVEFILARVQNLLPNLLKNESNAKHIENQFKRILSSKYGIYALVDYVNFKGEGVAVSADYNNNGWGLKQVLQNMNGSKTGKNALEDFSKACKMVLKNRVDNAPTHKNEQKFLNGWYKRCETYILV